MYYFFLAPLLNLLCNFQRRALFLGINTIKTRIRNRTRRLNLTWFGIVHRFWLTIFRFWLKKSYTFGCCNAGVCICSQRIRRVKFNNRLLLIKLNKRLLLTFSLFQFQPGLFTIKPKKCKTKIITNLKNKFTKLK